jgi:hypothetical protein
VIPKMPELDEAHSELEWEGIGLDAPHGANGSTGIFLNKLKPRFVMSPTNLPFLVQVTMMSVRHFIKLLKDLCRWRSLTKMINKLLTVLNM